MDQEIIEQFLLWLKEESNAPRALKGETVDADWYRQGYQDATEEVMKMYRIAFQGVIIKCCVWA